MLYKKIGIRLIIVAGCFLISSCGIYSFSGASVSPDIQTVGIDFFRNEAPIVVPVLSQQFTESLKDKILGSTTLSLAKDEGDINFEGEIIDYSTRPLSIQGNETASTTRLTISVRVRYTNKKNEKQSFESVFTRYSDYPSSQNLANVQTELIRQINSELVEDIFNRAFVNW
jgi:hypothetical protein